MLIYISLIGSLEDDIIFFSEGEGGDLQSSAVKDTTLEERKTFLIQILI